MGIMLVVTDRLDVLDSTLLRIGRFDWQIIVDLLDFAGCVRIHETSNP
jgi:ATP-dependent Zn protease